MKLYINGKEAQKGQEVTTFRGKAGILVGWQEPQHLGSTGRVFVNTGGAWDNDWFPDVIGGKFVEEIEERQRQHAATKRQELDKLHRENSRIMGDIQEAEARLSVMRSDLMKVNQEIAKLEGRD